MHSRTRPASRIPRTAPVAKRGPDPKRSASHLAFLRGLPCAICAAPPPCEACHIRTGTDAGQSVALRIGKAAAGRHLDGVLHDGYPAVAP